MVTTHMNSVLLGEGAEFGSEFSGATHIPVLRMDFSYGHGSMTVHLEELSERKVDRTIAMMRESMDRMETWNDMRKAKTIELAAAEEAEAEFEKLHAETVHEETTS